MMFAHNRKIGRAIRQILGSTHVATSYDDVAQDIADRATRGNMTAQATSRAITDAMIQHRRNRQDYGWVMGPH